MYLLRYDPKSIMHFDSYEELISLIDKNKATKGDVFTIEFQTSEDRLAFYLAHGKRFGMTLINQEGFDNV